MHRGREGAGHGLEKMLRRWQQQLTRQTRTTGGVGARQLLSPVMASRRASQRQLLGRDNDAILR